MLFVTEWNLDIALAAEREDALAEGMALGEKRGEKRGEARGIAQAAKALRALNAGKSVEEAAGISGLDADKVKELIVN
jgi:predicted transposase YdaD